MVDCSCKLKVWLKCHLYMYSFLQQCNLHYTRLLPEYFHHHKQDCKQHHHHIFQYKKYWLLQTQYNKLYSYFNRQHNWHRLNYIKSNLPHYQNILINKCKNLLREFLLFKLYQGKLRIYCIHCSCCMCSDIACSKEDWDSSFEDIVNSKSWSLRYNRYLEQYTVKHKCWGQLHW